jgi:hypothetical protein
MAAISHTAAFRSQADFAPDSKIKVGKSVWSEGVAGARLYAEVLSKHPGTVGKAMALASELKPPFTDKAVQGHLKWLYTAGELEVDGKSYDVTVKAPKPAKVEAPKPEAAKPEQPKVEAKAEAKTPRKRFSGKRKAA